MMAYQEMMFDLCWNLDFKEDEPWTKLRQYLDRKISSDGHDSLVAAVRCRKYGTTSLHLILGHRPPVDIVQKILQISLTTAKMSDDGDGYLPLHLACHGRASLEVIDALIKAAPDALHVKDLLGMMPIHHACTSGKAASLKIIKRLISEAPDTLRETDNILRLPLHISCDSQPCLQVLMLLVDNYPESVSVPDKKGRTPLNILKKSDAAGELVSFLRHAQPSLSSVSAPPLCHVSLERQQDAKKTSNSQVMKAPTRSTLETVPLIRKAQSAVSLQRASSPHRRGLKPSSEVNYSMVALPDVSSSLSICGLEPISEAQNNMVASQNVSTPPECALVHSTEAQINMQPKDFGALIEALNSQISEMHAKFDKLETVYDEIAEMKSDLKEIKDIVFNLQLLQRFNAR